MQDPAKNMTPEAAVQDMLQFLKVFAAFLEEETEALRAAEYDRADDMQHRKKELSHQYQSRIQVLVNRKEEIQKMPEQIKEMIIQARLAFSKVLTENLQAIDGVRQSSQRMVNRILESARESVSEDAGYNAHGQIYSTTSKGSSPVSIRLNETF